jgi:hypothetical protein
MPTTKKTQTKGVENPQQELLRIQKMLKDLADTLQALPLQKKRPFAPPSATSGYGSSAWRADHIGWDLRRLADEIAGLTLEPQKTQERLKGSQSLLCWDCEHNRRSTCPHDPNRPTNICRAFLTNPAVDYGDAPRKKAVLRKLLSRNP